MKRLKRLINCFVNSIFYLGFKDPLVISAWVKVRFGKVVHRNWGDELNVYLREKLTGRKVLVANESLLQYLFPSRKYICIGSILGWYETEKSEVWGTGAMTDEVVLRNPSAKVHLVRGKYTRQVLLDKGIECPECYGDPALLLSRLYQPDVPKRYRMGIIPHYDDENLPYLKEYVARHSDVCLISMSEYDRWTDVLDKINSCSFIISSSLHGLIAADSYGIPNFWVTFTEKFDARRDFKYRDYFSSVGRDESAVPLMILNGETLDQVYDLRYEEKCEKAVIDFDAILNSCPFI